MDRKRYRYGSLHQRVLGFGIVAFTAYAGCVADPPKKVDPGAGGSSGDTGAGGTGGSGKGGSGGANSAGSSGSGGSGNAGGTDTVDGGAAGMDPGSAGEGGEAPVECDDGFVTCPGSDECATDLDVGNTSDDTVDDCGACGVTCSLTHATSATCSDGACEPECSDGFGDCNAETENDGCETDLSTLAACGACGRTCSRTGVATAACTDAKCEPTCAPGFFDCSEDDGSGDDDGCELFGDALATCGATCESSGTPCAGTQVCNAGTCGDAAGLVVFSIPFTATTQKQRYGNVFPSPKPDLTNATLVMRVYVPDALDGDLFVYPTDATSNNPGPGVRVALATLSAGWVDLEIPVGGVSSDFDPSSVHQLTIEVEAGTPGPWLNPTVLYVDSIRSTNALVNDTFDANIGPMIPSGSMKVEGSTLGWVAALPPPP